MPLGRAASFLAGGHSFTEALFCAILQNMKTHRFFVDLKMPVQGEITLSDREVIHQIKDVLRLRPGNSIALLDGSGTEFHGELSLVSKDKVIVHISDEGTIKKDSNTSKIKMKLFFAMIKKDKAEWVLQKCTELGVSSFHPVLSERTEKPNLNMDRAEKIIKEAAEQSERAELPVLHEIVSLEAALAECETPKIALHMDGERLDVSRFAGGEVAVFVGPEGGWGEKDMALFKDYGVSLVSINPHVLRAETASVAVSALLLLK